jgi:CDP-diacylglycerol pyrophosphatase
MRLLLGFVALLALGGAAQAADPDALWKIVSEKCVPNEREYGQPVPCAMVDLGDSSHGGYVVLKDLVGDTQYLLMPTAKVTGIEDPQILAPDAPNYVADAWVARHFTIIAANRNLPRDDISLAINSVYGRTQNQLHIHIDCVAAMVRDAVAKNIAALGDKWAPFPAMLAGHKYRALRLGEDGLDRVNAFQRIAEGIPGARAAMDKQTLVVVGVTLPSGTAGFVLLEGEADLAAGDRGSGEELQDHSCALAKE